MPVLFFSQQQPVAQASAVQRPLGPVRRQHDRVPGGTRTDRGLRAEHMRLDGRGRGRPAGSAQLRAGVLHARGGRPAGAHGLRRARVAGVRPRPGAAVRVGDRRGFRRGRARPAARARPVRSLLLRHRGPAPVRLDRKGEWYDTTPPHIAAHNRIGDAFATSATIAFCPADRLRRIAYLTV